MAQVINTNVSALFGSATLNKSSVALQTAMARLSSGIRINSAKDDATGMVTASGYEKIMRGANIAVRNASDGISDAQINEGLCVLYVAMTRAADYLYVSYQEAGMSDDFGFGYRRSWAPQVGGLCEYLSPKPIRKLFQVQYASSWKEMELV